MSFLASPLIGLRVACLRLREHWWNVLWFVSPSRRFPRSSSDFVQDFLIDDKEFVSGPEWAGLNPTLPIYI